ncbi:amino acid/polyamine transporter I [Clohesyomyces aquaticus]|uniref:Amino acid/polyamine transporter I n=1 Tax=Clohesyomyces aquaticus TaxID=1231657 RepID=A0A1Y1Z4C0_9PLEO|nr:amino acid/polyamine transporter I [Clohesyomyces aquaticus]
MTKTMDDAKETSIEPYEVGVPEEFPEDDGEASIRKGTSADRKAMWRMGKVQELRRNFRFVSMFGFTMIVMGTWQWCLSTAQIGLFNGGTAGFIWMFVVCWAGFITVYLSMAEMGSMAPTSGGQYHWVSEFAPPKYQKLLSYLIGWLSVLGWQTGAAVSAFVSGTQIQGLIALNNPNYVFQAWHGTLLTFAVAALNLIFNVFLAKRLPMVESVVLVVHVFGFIAIISVLWVMGPITDAHTTFTTFNDGGAWDNLALSALVGFLAGLGPLLAGDAPVHMSEELRDASKNLPRAMIWTVMVNGVMGLVMCITFASCLGNLEDALGTTTRQPFLYVFYNATKSLGGASAMGAVVLFMIVFSNLTTTATASRQLFAFARDQGVPMNKIFSRVSPTWDVPVNALVFSFVVSCLLALINLGSVVALNNIATLNIAANMLSYMVSISCILRRRILGEPLLPAKFTLGRFGLAANVTAVLFLIFAFIMSFFPPEPHPSSETMNWACIVVGATGIFSAVYYYVKGRHVYVGPVAYVRKLS